MLTDRHACKYCKDVSKNVCACVFFVYMKRTYKSLGAIEIEVEITVVTALNMFY